MGAAGSGWRRISNSREVSTWLLARDQRRQQARGMGFVDNAQAVAVMQHQMQAKDAASATVGFLSQLLEEQRQTNRLLAAMLTPEAAERLRAEDEARRAAEAAAAAAQPQKKGRWRG
jgi:hypothetical protein